MKNIIIFVFVCLLIASCNSVSPTQSVNIRHDIVSAGGIVLKYYSKGTGRKISSFSDNQELIRLVEAELKVKLTGSEVNAIQEMVVYLGL